MKRSRLLDKHVERARLKHLVARVRRVSGYVAQSPDGLLLDVLLGRAQQRHERADAASSNHAASLRLSARSDVRQSPRRLELRNAAQQMSVGNTDADKQRK